jgi:hypothetical protein
LKILDINVVLNRQHRTVAASSVAGLSTLDAGTSTHVVYAVSSVAEKKVGNEQDLKCIFRELAALDECARAVAATLTAAANKSWSPRASVTLNRAAT